ncbi:hypothetical protein B0H16DRAFT_1794029 [Mycena metata]|uniref:Uncharacterized protein n=1 Tax=Mycena metata TaxID=1033252 RepID=A0AAD7HFY3_9AGAR|nr:hypothetical protein B0H16DRAFT_1794029 [Mycena metata]
MSNTKLAPALNHLDRASLELKAEKYAGRNLWSESLVEAGLPPISDEDLDLLVKCSGFPPTPEGREGFLKKVNLDRLAHGNPKTRVFGQKPGPNDTSDVRMLPIPNSGNCYIRLFPGGTTRNEGYFYFDFFDGAVGTPFNSPSDWMLYELMGPSQRMRMPSSEEAFGILRKYIVPGAERFQLWGQLRCRLVRPRHPDFDFRIPARDSEVGNGWKEIV